MNTPAVSQPHMFCVEKGETPAADRLVRTGHNYGDTYYAQWAPENDGAVRAFFRKNRIRPLTRGGGKDPISYEAGPGRPRFSCLLSWGSVQKLDPIATHEIGD